jgi:putative transposase
VTRAWPRRNEIPIWQREYWDRQLRSDESYAQKWDYVVNNPVRHGYVACAEDWP